ncbi:MAG: hypothetical protein O7D97_04135 [Planctomycetota bacterium]|nr:hypothetical protein [Planctomycetota bacterium]
MTHSIFKRRLPAVVILGLCWAVHGQVEPATPAQRAGPSAQAPAGAEPKHPLEVLLDQIDELQAQIQALRRELAAARLQTADAERELGELRQFIADHHEFGQDFEQYQALKAIAQQEARLRKAEVTRQRREAERAQRAERRQASRSERVVQEVEAKRRARYRRAGFSSLGLEVQAGRMAYHYRTKDTTRYDIEYSPFLGLYYLDRDRRTVIDYSSMTISGSVLNAAKEVRNIGVAITFFDENSNQVGGEIIQINNARPDVPYPFTATVQMALNRPFNSSSTYVLYADPVDAEQPAPDVTDTRETTPSGSAPH